ncbi:MAG TPA: aminoglycoside phosphotransferase family protein [Anaerolineae bacterium]|nr:aminoglycoside phosphotransferase family protein [Anaerolineae bacterium]
MNDDQAHQLVGHLLGMQPLDLTRYRPPVGGDDSYSYRFSAGGERLLLKVKKTPATPVGLYFYQRVKAAGVPVPELVAFAPDAGPEGQACAIWSWVDGRPATWGAGHPCPYDEAAFGELLRQIHALRFDGEFGLLGDDLARRTFSSHPDLRATSDTWLGFFDCEAAARRYRDKGYLDRRDAVTLARLPERLQCAFLDVEARLLHMGDIMHHGNMLIGPHGEILAVVDYVESTAGDPRWELAWVGYYFSIYPFDRRSFDMDRFRAAYGTDHDPDDEVGRFYLLAILLFEKLLFFSPQSDRGRWAIHAVKRLLREYQ